MDDTVAVDQRVPPPVDGARCDVHLERWFIVFIALECVAFAFVPLLPLGIAIAGLSTPLARSRWRMVVLLVLGLLLSLVVMAPFIIGSADIQIVDNGPAQTVSPR